MDKAVIPELLQENCTNYINIAFPYTDDVMLIGLGFLLTLLFVYVIRFGTEDWIIKFLVEHKGNSIELATQKLSFLAIQDHQNQNHHHK